MTLGSRINCETHVSLGTFMQRVVSTTLGIVIWRQRLTTIGSGIVLLQNRTFFLQIRRGGCCIVMHLGRGRGGLGAHCGN